MKLTSWPRRGTAGHGWNCAGQGAATGQSPRPAYKPGPSPPSCPAFPPSPSKPQCHPSPPMPVLTLWHKMFLYYQEVTSSLSPHGPQMFQANARLGVYFNFSSQRPDLTIQPAQEGPGVGWGLEVAQGRRFSHAHHLPGLSVQFLVSGKLCLPGVTDG